MHNCVVTTCIIAVVALLCLASGPPAGIGFTEGLVVAVFYAYQVPASCFTALQPSVVRRFDQILDFCHCHSSMHGSGSLRLLLRGVTMRIWLQQVLLDIVMYFNGSTAVWDCARCTS